MRSRNRWNVVVVSLLVLLAACAHSQKEPDSGVGLTKAEVGDAIHAHLDQLKSCHEKANKRAGSVVTGTVRTHFVVGSSGAVKSVTKESSDLPDPRLEDCVFDLIRKTKFPKPQGGIDVSVSYPFRFKQAPSGLIEQIFGD